MHFILLSSESYLIPSFLPSFLCSVKRVHVEPQYCLGTYGLSLHEPWLADDLVWSTLDDTAGFGKRGADAHEVGIDVTSSLATFVDAPADSQHLFDRT